ncbi:MAG: sensor histidine kinase, partial [Verrucomicrobiae bacterium]|nr:sensor histidine kinase [Verrucomicrobiae bacterium]
VGVLRSVLRDLEDRIRDRTASLLDEMAQRRRLETEVVEIAEREQRRIGVDLHDSLGQHLTAISIAVEVLRSDLKQPKEAAAAKKILELVENGIELTRSLARDMLPAELGTRDFATAFQKLADNTSQRYGVECRFASEGEVNLRDSALASQLYRIAQEAITNSIRHAKANRIDLRLAKIGGVLDLTIIDNGTGLRSSSGTDGLGVRIMAHRASVIGGTFEISNAAQGGASVRCRCPLNGTAVSTSATS